MSKTKSQLDAEYYQRNKERIKTRASNYYKANKSLVSEKQKEYYEENKEAILKRNGAFAKANRALMTQYHLAYVKRNRNKWTAQTALYRAGKLQATPAWADLKAVKEIYKLAAKWNEIWPEDRVDVDHIVPLKGKNVSGLHTEVNLQILRSIENKRKSNKV